MSASERLKAKKRGNVGKQVDKVRVASAAINVVYLKPTGRRTS